MYVEEFGPLLAAWARLPGESSATFDEALPWQVGAILRVGAYAPPEVEDDTPQMSGPVRRGNRRVPSRRAGSPHPRSQADLIQARLDHARDPERFPKPEIIGPGAVGISGLGVGPTEP